MTKSACPVTTNKPKIVVVKKKKVIARRITGTKQTNGGLPKFQLRLPMEEQLTTTPVHNDEDSLGRSPKPKDHLDNSFDDLPCDTMLAIQSLQQESKGLHVPLLQSHTCVQVLLESQIFQRFQEDHASTIWSELRQLTRSNQVRILSYQRGNSTSTQGTCGGTKCNAYLLTNDYITGVWNAQHHHAQAKHSYEPLVSWFLSALAHWTGTILSKDDMELQWNEDLFAVVANDATTSQRLSLDDAINYLSKIQVLLRDTSNTTSSQECFVIWLPQWGLVLKHWTEARQQLLGLVARAGEISERNLLNKNRHSAFSTKFLLDELKQQGLLRSVERPFGTFVQRVMSK